jgi:hypothetical protein
VFCGPLQQTLFLLFLTLNAVAGPRHGIQAFALDVLLALNAEPVGTLVSSPERILDKLEDATIVITLVEKKFLGVRIRGPVSGVLRNLIVGLAAILL